MKLENACIGSYASIERNDIQQSFATRATRWTEYVKPQELLTYCGRRNKACGIDTAVAAGPAVGLPERDVPWKMPEEKTEPFAIRRKAYYITR